MISLEIKEFPDSEWDKRISLSIFGRYQQTIHHANFMKQYREFQPRYAIFKKGDKIIGQQLIFLRQRGTTSIKKVVGKFIKPFYFWKSSILIFDENYQEEILKEFASFMSDKKFSGIDNPIANYKLDLPSTKAGTVIIEIKKSFEETISKRDPTSTQKHVAMAAHEEVPTKTGLYAIRVKSDEQIRNFFDMLNDHRIFLGLETLPTFSSFRDRITTLNRHEHGGALMALHDGKPVSAIIYFNYNGWLQNSSVANTRYGLEKKLSALDYLRCYLISIGVKSSAKFFDVGGISLNPKTDKEAGIRHSQTKWGGKIFEYNRYSNI